MKSSSQNLITLARLMAGEFDNQPQAMEQPAWFVHLRLWYRPLPMRIEGNLALFAEQANAVMRDPLRASRSARPYRHRVAILTESLDALRVQYLAFKQPEKFLGAGADPSRLEALRLDDLEALPGCVLTVTEQAGKFKATPEPGAKCYFQYDGATRQVVLGFEVSPGKFWSYDRGVDPETGQGLWGALMGAYEFKKCEDFASELLF